MDTMGNLDDLWDYDDPALSEARFRQWLIDLQPSAGASQWAEAETQLARAQGLQRRFADAHTTLDAVEARLDEVSVRARIRYSLERGRVFNSSGVLERAEPLFLAAWELARANGEDELAVDAAHMLAIVATGEDAFTWNWRALELAQASTQLKAQQWQAGLYNNIGWSYFDDGRYDDAMAMFERALERRRADGAVDKEIGIAQWCIARTLRALGMPEEALVMQRSLLATQAEEGYVSEEMGECLLALGYKEESQPHFRRAAEMLARNPWLAAREPERLERLRQLGEARSAK